MAHTVTLYVGTLLILDITYGYGPSWESMWHTIQRTSKLRRLIKEADYCTLPSTESANAVETEVICQQPDSSALPTVCEGAKAILQRFSRDVSASRAGTPCGESSNSSGDDKSQLLMS